MTPPRTGQEEPRPSGSGIEPLAHARGSETDSAGRAGRAAGRLPRHVAIIMDGNGRWGLARGQGRLAGHERGVAAAREAAAGALETGIEVLSLYAFSTLNWRRPPEEVGGLFRLLEHYLSQEADALAQSGVRLRVLGDRRALPPEVRAAVSHAEARTANQRKLMLNLGVNYGGQEELVGAVRCLAREAAAGRLKPDEVNAARLEACLDTQGLPPVDLLIRTAGERRLSNFLLWQSAFAELLFLDVLWPDFTRAHLESALRDFARRRRTFGGLAEVREPLAAGGRPA